MTQDPVRDGNSPGVAAAESGSETSRRPARAKLALAIPILCVAGGAMYWAFAPDAAHTTSKSAAEDDAAQAKLETGKPAAHESKLKPAKPADPQRAAENAMLQEVRTSLRKRDYAGAESALARMQSSFPDGALQQEREVLRIELMLARGQPAEAGRAARTFMATYPNTPHASKLRRLIREP